MPYVRSKVTGEVVEVDASGRPVGRAQPPRDPTFPYQAPKAQADIAQSQAGTVNTQVSTQRTLGQMVGDALANETAAKTLAQNPISAADQAFINKQREGAQGINKLISDIDAGASTVDRFQPAPGKGILYGAGTPTDDDYATTVLAKKLVGEFLPDDQQENWQRLTGLQNSAVLAGQQQQAGVQTEGDALRQKLTAISPNKSVRVNAQVLADARYDAGMAQQRPGFYTFWANQNGSLNALNKDGKSADQVWNEFYQQGLAKMRRSPTYTGRAGNGRASTAGAPRRSGVIDFNDLPEGR